MKSVLPFHDGPLDGQTMPVADGCRFFEFPTGGRVVREYEGEEYMGFEMGVYERTSAGMKWVGVR